MTDTPDLVREAFEALSFAKNYLERVDAFQAAHERDYKSEETSRLYDEQCSAEEIAEESLEAICRALVACDAQHRAALAEMEADIAALKERSSDPCIDKRRPGELMFVLLARDSAAADTLEHWCGLRADEIVNGKRENTTQEWAHIMQVREKAKAFRATLNPGATHAG